MSVEISCRYNPAGNVDSLTGFPFGSVILHVGNVSFEWYGDFPYPNDMSSVAAERELMLFPSFFVADGTNYPIWEPTITATVATTGRYFSSALPPREWDYVVDHTVVSGYGIVTGPPGKPGEMAMIGGKWCVCRVGSGLFSPTPYTDPVETDWLSIEPFNWFP